jgi:predicted metal-dependent hydrolase
MTTASSQLQLFQSRDVADRWTVRVSRRARRLSVRVYPGGRVEVVAPPGASPAIVQRFVGTHRQWIDRRIQDLAAADMEGEIVRPESIHLTAVQRTYVIGYRATSARGVRVRLRDGEKLSVEGLIHDERAVRRALRQWLAKEAARALGMQLQEVAQAAGLRFARVQIRRQRTRWGSCSATGTISLNVCLLFLDPLVVRYLLIHELSHTKHMNHSERFWALVASHEPDYRRLDRELLRGWQRVPGWMFV